MNKLSITSNLKEPGNEMQPSKGLRRAGGGPSKQVFKPSTKLRFLYTFLLCFAASGCGPLFKQYCEAGLKAKREGEGVGGRGRAPSLSVWSGASKTSAFLWGGGG